ncbi:carbohydrate-binding protein [Streptomyces sp. NPDC060031]|uniref:carbohydrate-binding protein n=1 Tax=Streptomyces sp. NPDC060031 TaxID=3347043 RepID=UPI0036900AFE
MSAALPQWTVGRPYAKSDEVAYQGRRYICLFSHTSQARWAPGQAPTLWVMCSDALPWHMR